MMSKVVSRLMALVASVRRPLALSRKRSSEMSCGEDGCYTLADGTLVPLGDFGVTPTEYNLVE